jgi:hypothetical protein
MSAVIFDAPNNFVSLRAMRQVEKQQIQLGETSISLIELNPKSRDDIPQLLAGLQHIYVTPDIRREVFGILETIVPEGVDRDTGRPGMELWKILVMGTLRLNLNWDYDRLHEMVNNHRTIRQMLGHGMVEDEDTYNLQTIKDNVFLLTPEILDEINQVVVRAGHSLVKKGEPGLRGRCDSFVVETDVHWPTDTSLLWDAIRKVIELVAAICGAVDWTEWRQAKHNLRRVKRLLRRVQNLKRSTSKDATKKEARDQLIRDAHREYLDTVMGLLAKAEGTCRRLVLLKVVLEPELAHVRRFMDHAYRQLDQVERRVLEGETIPHDQKVFSVFEEHTEWINKGKAGVLAELGLAVCVLEDQHGFILHHEVLQRQVDVQVAVPMVREAKRRFPALNVCSFDKGFWSRENRVALGDILDAVGLPKKGKRSKSDQAVELSEDFAEARRKHAAVESAINALEVHGLDRCPDHGLVGFKRYVALAVVARNIQQLGALIRRREAEGRARQKKTKEAA